jgi:hypothetical protein
MFGLRNFQGSCWVNTCIQSILRIPDVQTRYDEDLFDKENPIDLYLSQIWKSKGTTGLPELFGVIQTQYMPAGRGIGDAHELLQYLCDKLPFLDELMRFKTAHSIKCTHCDATELRQDSEIEFSLSTNEKNKPIHDCIVESVQAELLEDWKCEKCHEKGCRKQKLLGTFPKVMTFHMIPTSGSIEYPSTLVLNSMQYVLISVCCYDGAHWWAYGRNMPSSLCWYTLNDLHVQEHGPKQFPLSNKMRMLIYYRLEN